MSFSDVIGNDEAVRELRKFPRVVVLRGDCKYSKQALVNAYADALDKDVVQSYHVNTRLQNKLIYVLDAMGVSENVFSERFKKKAKQMVKRGNVLVISAQSCVFFDGNWLNRHVINVRTPDTQSEMVQIARKHHSTLNPNEIAFLFEDVSLDRVSALAHYKDMKTICKRLGKYFTEENTGVDDSFVIYEAVRACVLARYGRPDKWYSIYGVREVDYNKIRNMSIQDAEAEIAAITTAAMYTCDNTGYAFTHKEELDYCLKLKDYFKIASTGVVRPVYPCSKTVDGVVEFIRLSKVVPGKDILLYLMEHDKTWLEAKE